VAEHWSGVRGVSSQESVQAQQAQGTRSNKRRGGRHDHRHMAQRPVVDSSGYLGHERIGDPTYLLRQILGCTAQINTYRQKGDGESEGR